MISIEPTVGAARRSGVSVDLERYEAKYLIHPGMVPAIREFIAPFCAPDRHADSETTEYIVTTLQLDSADMALCRAREEEALNRFKLRVRTYGLNGESPVFLEIKRKINDVIAKTRVELPFEAWSPEICLSPSARAPIHPSQAHDYLDFVRLVQQLGARPKVLIRYHRESYLGINELYLRLTLDRRLTYRVHRSWELLPNGGRWWHMDSALSMRSPFSGVVLELKTFCDVPVWMIDMIKRFNLVRIGFCKYYTAVRLESLLAGDGFPIAGEPYLRL